HNVPVGIRCEKSPAVGRETNVPVRSDQPLFPSQDPSLAPRGRLHQSNVAVTIEPSEPSLVGGERVEGGRRESFYLPTGSGIPDDPWPGEPGQSLAVAPKAQLPCG